MFYTLEGIYLNNQPVTFNRLRTEGVGDSGFLLGGSIDGHPMPTTISLYNQGDALYTFDENGKFAGSIPVPEGSAKLKISVAVWAPINKVEIIDYSQYEGRDTNETKDHHTVDPYGYSQLWTFRPEQYNLFYNASQSGAHVYKEALHELGWLELLDTIEVETIVELNKKATVRVIPEKQEYKNESFDLKLDSFDLAHSGGSLKATLSGSGESMLDFLQHCFLVDTENETILSSGTYWDSSVNDSSELSFSMTITPLTTELPNKLLIAPAYEYNELWDPASPNYDPTLTKPDNAIQGWLFELEQCIDLSLQTIP